MDLFRAFMLKPEYSARTLGLTMHLIRCNPSNYSLWAYRARIILQDNVKSVAPDANSSSSDPFLPQVSPTREGRLADELDFMDVLAKENMKNYQVWQHRKVIVTELGHAISKRASTDDASAAGEEWKAVAGRELAFVRDALKQDAKNYHTWAYRQWVLGHFGGMGNVKADTSGAGEGSISAIRKAVGDDVWSQELAYVEELLEEDLRNNSAWNHRFFTLFASGRASSGPNDDAEDEIIEQEVQYSIKKLGIAKNNSSAWGYLRGIMQRLKQRSDSKSSPNESEKVYVRLRKSIDDFAASLIPSNEEYASDPEIEASGNSVPLALEWLMDSKAEQGEVKEAGIYIDRLIKADPMRARYWEYRRSVLSKS